MKKTLSIVLTVLIIASAAIMLTPQKADASREGQINTWGGIIVGSILFKDEIRGFVHSIFTGSQRGYQQQPVYQQPVQVQYRSAPPVIQRTIYRPQNDFRQSTDCHKVQERVFIDGQLVKDEVTEICNGERRTSTY